MKHLLLAMASLPIQQSIAYLALLVLPVAAPVVTEELALDPAFIGLYTGIIFAVSTAAQMGCGGVIQRFGGLRAIQTSMVILGVGLVISAAGSATVFLFAAVLMGIFYSVSTPGSSHILSKYSPPQLAPLTFSIKQTGVPLGGMAAGFIVPFFVSRFGWEGAFIGCGIICVFMALILQPLRSEFDRDREPGTKISPKDILRTFRSTIRMVSLHPELRNLAFAGFSFAGLQLAFTTYFVMYMVQDLGHSLGTAGWVFAVSQAFAIGARIFWGVVGSRWMTSRWLLAFLGVTMGAASVAVGLFDNQWSTSAILLIAILISVTAIGWNGILLAEIARLAPSGNVGGTTGGVIGFASFGSMAFPAVYSLLLSLTGSFSLGFYIAGIPAFIAGLLLMRKPS
ncbi:MAG: MFS transporter [Gammaproteobacteria bacterium]|nr:MFS transporter [Gammaproteobacteria bacterium]